MSSGGSLIATTRDASLQPLGTQGHLAVQSWQQITCHLRRHLGPAHAALLAQPHPGQEGGTTDWYAEAHGVAQPINSLPAPLQEAARDRLAILLHDIQATVTTLRQSAAADDHALAELLILALVVPAQEHVWVANGQPVLVAWGHCRRDAEPDQELLIAIATPSDTPRPGPVGALRQGPAPRGRRRAAPLFIPTLLLLLALLLLWFDAWRWVQAAPLDNRPRTAMDSPSG